MADEYTPRPPKPAGPGAVGGGDPDDYKNPNVPPIGTPDQPDGIGSRRPYRGEGTSPETRSDEERMAAYNAAIEAAKARVGKSVGIQTSQQVQETNKNIEQTKQSISSELESKKQSLAQSQEEYQNKLRNRNPERDLLHVLGEIEYKKREIAELEKNRSAVDKLYNQSKKQVETAVNRDRVVGIAQKESALEAHKRLGSQQEVRSVGGATVLVSAMSPEVEKATRTNVVSRSPSVLTSMTDTKSAETLGWGTLNISNKQPTEKTSPVSTSFNTIDMKTIPDIMSKDPLTKLYGGLRYSEAVEKGQVTPKGLDWLLYGASRAARPIYDPILSVVELTGKKVERPKTISSTVFEKAVADFETKPTFVRRYGSTKPTGLEHIIKDPTSILELPGEYLLLLTSSKAADYGLKIFQKYFPLAQQTTKITVNPVTETVSKTSKITTAERELTAKGPKPIPTTEQGITILEKPVTKLTPTVTITKPLEEAGTITLSAKGTPQVIKTIPTIISEESLVSLEKGGEKILEEVIANPLGIVSSKFPKGSLVSKLLITPATKTAELIARGVKIRNVVPEGSTLGQIVAQRFSKGKVVYHGTTAKAGRIPSMFEYRIKNIPNVYLNPVKKLLKRDEPIGTDIQFVKANPKYFGFSHPATNKIYLNIKAPHTEQTIVDTLIHEPIHKTLQKVGGTKTSESFDRLDPFDVFDITKLNKPDVLSDVLLTPSTKGKVLPKTKLTIKETVGTKFLSDQPQTKTVWRGLSWRDKPLIGIQEGKLVRGHDPEKVAEAIEKIVLGRGKGVLAIGSGVEKEIFYGEKTLEALRQKGLILPIAKERALQTKVLLEETKGVKKFVGEFGELPIKGLTQRQSDYTLKFFLVGEQKAGTVEAVHGSTALRPQIKPEIKEQAGSSLLIGDLDVIPKGKDIEKVSAKLIEKYSKGFPLEKGQKLTREGKKIFLEEPGKERKKLFEVVIKEPDEEIGSGITKGAKILGYRIPYSETVTAKDIPARLHTARFQQLTNISQVLSFQKGIKTPLDIYPDPGRTKDIVRSYWKAKSDVLIKGGEKGKRIDIEAEKFRSLYPGIEFTDVKPEKVLLYSSRKEPLSETNKIIKDSGSVFAQMFGLKESPPSPVQEKSPSITGKQTTSSYSKSLYKPATKSAYRGSATKSLYQIPDTKQSSILPISKMDSVISTKVQSLSPKTDSVWGSLLGSKQPSKSTKSERPNQYDSLIGPSTKPSIWTPSKGPSVIPPPSKPPTYRSPPYSPPSKPPKSPPSSPPSIPPTSSILSLTTTIPPPSSLIFDQEKRKVPIIPLVWKTRKEKRIEEEQKDRYPFLGNVKVSEIEGVFGKRPDIQYGEKKTAKLVLKDLVGSSKGKFSKTKKFSIGSSATNVFTEKKSTKSKKDKYSALKW